MTISMEGHIPCTRCRNPFPAEQLWTGDSSKGWRSLETNKPYCSKQCCELAEGDPMQNAYNLECPECGKPCEGEFCSEGCAKEDRLDRM